MRYMRAAGMIALALLLIPMIWDGYSSLPDDAGPGCIIDGDVGRRVEHVYLITSETPVPEPTEGQTFALQEGYGGACRLGRQPGASQMANRWWWQADGQVYKEGYDVDLSQQNFPPEEWDWEITLTWTAGLMTLDGSGWGGRILKVTLPIIPFASIMAALAVAARELSRGPVEDGDVV